MTDFLFKKSDTKRTTPVQKVSLFLALDCTSYLILTCFSLISRRNWRCIRNVYEFCYGLEYFNRLRYLSNNPWPPSNFHRVDDIYKHHEKEGFTMKTKLQNWNYQFCFETGNKKHHFSSVETRSIDQLWVSEGSRTTVSRLSVMRKVRHFKNSDQSFFHYLKDFSWK